VRISTTWAEETDRYIVSHTHARTHIHTLQIYTGLSKKIKSVTPWKITSSLRKQGHFLHNCRV